MITPLRSPNTVMVDDESNEEPLKKKLKGLAGILKHILSLRTIEEITVVKRKWNVK